MLYTLIMFEPKKEPFDIDHLVELIKATAKKTDAKRLIKNILQKAVSNPEWISKSIPKVIENEVILFEDDSVSIWHCRFMPGQTVPPHDHQMTASIGVYQGSEQNDFFTLNNHGKLNKDNQIHLSSGNVLQIEKDTIHAVSCASEEPCCGIHVYQGNLTEVNRNLFDLKTNAVMKFTNENYHNLMRKKS